MIYKFDMAVSESKRRNLGSIVDSLYLSFTTTSEHIIVETVRELSAEEQSALVSAISNVADVVVFNLDALDAWLLGEEALKSYTGFFPIISRASEKNTVAGYQLMVMVAQSQEYNIPQNIIDLVVNKLSELGAKIQ